MKNLFATLLNATTFLFLNKNETDVHLIPRRLEASMDRLSVVASDPFDLVNETTSLLEQSACLLRFREILKVSTRFDNDSPSLPSDELNSLMLKINALCSETGNLSEEQIKDLMDTVLRLPLENYEVGVYSHKTQYKESTLESTAAKNIAQLFDLASKSAGFPSFRSRSFNPEVFKKSVLLMEVIAEKFPEIIPFACQGKTLDHFPSILASTRLLKLFFDNGRQMDSINHQGRTLLMDCLYYHSDYKKALSKYNQPNDDSFAGSATYLIEQDIDTNKIDNFGDTAFTVALHNEMENIAIYILKNRNGELLEEELNKLKIKLYYGLVGNEDLILLLPFFSVDSKRKIISILDLQDGFDYSRLQPHFLTFLQQEDRSEFSNEEVKSFLKVFSISGALDLELSDIFSYLSKEEANRLLLFIDYSITSPNHQNFLLEVSKIASDVNLKNNRSQTPLMLALDQGADAGFIDTLFNAGADIFQPCFSGEVLLLEYFEQIRPHLLSPNNFQSYLESIKYLLETVNLDKLMELGSNDPVIQRQLHKRTLNFQSLHQADEASNRHCSTDLERGDLVNINATNMLDTILRDFKSEVIINILDTLFNIFPESRIPLLTFQCGNGKRLLLQPQVLENSLIFNFLIDKGAFLKPSNAFEQPFNDVLLYGNYEVINKYISMGRPIKFTPTESLLSNLFGRDDSKRLIDLLLEQNVFDLKTNFEGLTLISAASRGEHIEIIDYLLGKLDVISGEEETFTFGEKETKDLERLLKKIAFNQLPLPEDISFLSLLKRSYQHGAFKDIHVWEKTERPLTNEYPDDVDNRGPIYYAPLCLKKKEVVEFFTSLNVDFSKPYQTNGLGIDNSELFRIVKAKDVSALTQMADLVDIKPYISKLWDIVLRDVPEQDKILEYLDVLKTLYLHSKVSTWWLSSEEVLNDKQQKLFFERIFNFLVQNNLSTNLQEFVQHLNHFKPIIQKFLNVFTAENSGNYIFMLKNVLKDIQLTSFFLDCGVDVNAQRAKDKRTMLMDAIYYGYSETATLLFQTYGAKLHIVDKYGKTAFDIAKQKDLDELHDNMATHFAVYGETTLDRFKNFLPIHSFGKEGSSLDLVWIGMCAANLGSCVLFITTLYLMQLNRKKNKELAEHRGVERRLNHELAAVTLQRDDLRKIIASSSSNLEFSKDGNETIKSLKAQLIEHIKKEDKKSYDALYPSYEKAFHDEKTKQVKIAQSLFGETFLDDFNCPISFGVVRDPVAAADGHIYDRSALETWINDPQRFPRCMFTLNGTQFKGFMGLSPKTNKKMFFPGSSIPEINKSPVMGTLKTIIAQLPLAFLEEDNLGLLPNDFKKAKDLILPTSGSIYDGPSEDDLR